MPRGNNTVSGLTPVRRKNLIWTKHRVRPTFCGWTQIFNQLDGSEGAENLRFQGPREIQIADHFRRSGVSRELYNKARRYKRCAESYLVLSGINHKFGQDKSTGSFQSEIIGFSTRGILGTNKFFFELLQICFLLSWSNGKDSKSCDRGLGADTKWHVICINFRAWHILMKATCWILDVKRYK